MGHGIKLTCTHVFISTTDKCAYVYISGKLALVKTSSADKCLPCF